MQAAGSSPAEDTTLAAPETPEARLLRIMEEVLDNEATSGRLFGEMGLEGIEHELRVRMFLCYKSCERVVFPGLPKSKRRELFDARHELLYRQPGA